MATVSNERHLRYILLLGEGGTLILREILKREIMTSGNALTVLLNGHENQIKRKTDKASFLKAYPTDGSPDETQWDISLLAVIILQLFKGSITREESIEISNIKDLRNNLAHTSSFSMNENEYDDCRKELAATLMKLSNGIDRSVHDKCQNFIKQFATGPIDIHAVTERVKEFSRFDQIISTALRSLTKDIADVNQKIDDLIMDVKEILRIANMGKKEFSNTFQVVGTTMAVESSNDRMNSLVEDSIKRLFTAALKRTGGEQQLPKVEVAVRKILEDIEDCDSVELSDVEQHCIKLTMRCKTCRGLLELLEYLESSLLQERLEVLSSALEEEFSGPFHIVVDITKESLEDIKQNLSVIEVCTITDQGVTEQSTAIDEGVTEDSTAIDTGVTEHSTAIDEGVTVDRTSIDEGVTEQSTAIDEGVTEDSTAIDTGVTEHSTAIDEGVTEDRTSIDEGVTEQSTAIDEGVTEDSTAIDTGVTEHSTAIDEGVTVDRTSIDEEDQIGVTEQSTAIDEGVTEDSTAIDTGVTEHSTAIDEGVTVDRTSIDEEDQIGVATAESEASFEISSASEEYSDLDLLEDNDIKQHFLHYGLKDINAVLQSALEKHGNKFLSIAVIGQTGTGKSSLINALMELHPGQEGAATVGEIEECTEDCQEYKHPKFPNVSFWDVPGADSKLIPKEKYIEQIQVDRYDFFLLIYTGRLKGSEIWLKSELDGLQKKCYLVYTKVDIDIISHSRRERKTEEESFTQLRNTAVASMTKSIRSGHMPKLFLISSYHTTSYDFPELSEHLIEDAPQQKKLIMIYSVGANSRKIIQEKAKALRKRIWPVVLLQTFKFMAKQQRQPTLLQVILDLVIDCLDITYIVREITFYREQFGLTDDNLLEIAKRKRISLPELKSKLQLKTNSAQFSGDGLKALIHNSEGYIKQKMPNLVPPTLLSQTSEISKSHEVASCFLEIILENMREDALKVLQYITQDN